MLNKTSEEALYNVIYPFILSCLSQHRELNRGSLRRISAGCSVLFKVEQLLIIPVITSKRPLCETVLQINEN